MTNSTGKGYLERLGIARAKGGIPDGFTHIQVAHDDDCSIYGGRECSCVPDITFESDNGVVMCIRENCDVQEQTSDQ